MKNFAKTLAAAVVICSAVISTSAMAEQKIGVIDVQSIFQALPQAALIQQSVAEEFKDQIQEVNTLREDGEYLVNKLQRESATLSAQEKEELQQQIVSVRDQLQQKGQPLQQEVQRRTREEQNKLLGLIRQAINTEAASEEYDIIFNAGAVSFSKEDFDLSKKVLDQISKIN